MIGVKGFVLCVMILLFPVFAAAEKAPAHEAGEIVAGVVAAYGGKSALAAVKTVVATGTVIEMMQDRKGSYLRYMDRAGRLRVEIMPELGGEVRVLDGNRGWQGDVENIRPARPMTMQSMLYQYGYLDLPMAFTASTSHVTYRGRKDLRGREVDLLQVEVKGAPGLMVAVDREKHLIARVSIDFSVGKGNELATEYGDYRLVGKVLFPFRLTNFMGDMKLSEITLDEIRVNEEIPKGLFPPR